jgi:hypothetical protein
LAVRIGAPARHQAHATATPDPGRRGPPRYLWGVLLLVPVLIVGGLYLVNGPGRTARIPGARPSGPGTAAGENIGEGGPMPDTTAAMAQMAVTLTQDMLNEQPPGDGHRLNILSSTFTHIGIAVYRDRAGAVWMTQDFSS